MQNTKLRLAELLQRPVNLPASGATTKTASITESELAPLGSAFIFAVDAPALTTTQLPNAQTLTYSILTSNNADLTSPVTTTQIGVQTGAGGAGAAAATLASKLPASAAKYVGLQIVASASALPTGLGTNFYLAAY